MSKSHEAKYWDADHYNESFDYIWRHGAGLLELLDPQPGERILDLGCGTGQLTEQIAQTGATVIGIDSSADMVEAARTGYPSIEFHHVDAADFHFDEPFDAVFSNAVLHWVHPPESAVRHIYHSLVPGGRLVAELGGQGNVELLVQAMVAELAEHGEPDAASRNPWYFPSIAEYTTLLESNGLEPVYARLYDRPTLLGNGDEGLSSWFTMFGDHFFGDISPETKQAVIDGVAERLRPHLYRNGDWYADYRRLQVVAWRE